MNFLEAVQSGEKVRRPSWPMNIFVQLFHSDKHVDAVTHQLVPAPYSAGLARFEKDVLQGTQQLVQLIDVLANDWEKYVAPVVEVVAPVVVAVDPNAAPAAAVAETVATAVEQTSQEVKSGS